MKPCVLIIDDEPAIGSSLHFALEDHFRTFACTNVSDAYKILQKHEVHVILLDLRLDNADGLDLLSEIKEMYPAIPVIIMTAFGSIESSVEAIKRGAFHYIMKPPEVDELLLLVKKSLEHQNLYNQVRELSKQIEKMKGYDQIIGKSPPMKRVFSIIDQVKDIDSNVLITGESGTGKELVARAIHHNGKRRNGPFIAINCAAIPESLLESELFGYAKGAFTGASSSRTGKIEAAQNGTLFLDEIGEMTPQLQAKLLRFLQEKEVTPLGSSDTIKVDVRIISATNQNLLDLIEKGDFREDLYFRLSVIPLHIPPLRERKDDLKLLIPYYLKKHAEVMNRPVPALSSEALQCLEQFSYPGNVRQLANILEYAVAMAKNRQIQSSDLPFLITDPLKSDFKTEKDENKNNLQIPIPSTLKEVEKKLIQAVLDYCKGNRRKTASLLKISERNLRNKLNQYKKEDENFKIGKNCR
ncbi:sigma-54-dependent transcriptional regulator [Thermoactinomyces mirandus]|uniref:Sigma-54-dependent Fis family transcriptional regulator n=1 Tax=Thermoactinomyces mirandus TaxID=2756294 RepID=A0A7W1XTU6_9BACL|nr:sigma-54 dependent transcriptional regulator [Thermoactinomyces mirandus]MBA4603088.1 sigma-54-dependent Fis family transcriptional regulator [Thermoactinomyces mirandus]